MQFACVSYWDFQSSESNQVPKSMEIIRKNGGDTIRTVSQQIAGFSLQSAWVVFMIFFWFLMIFSLNFWNHHQTLPPAPTRSANRWASPRLRFKTRRGMLLDVEQSQQGDMLYVVLLVHLILRYWYRNFFYLRYWDFTVWCLHKGMHTFSFRFIKKCFQLATATNLATAFCTVRRQFCRENHFEQPNETKPVIIKPLWGRPLEDIYIYIYTVITYLLIHLCIMY